MLMDFSEIKRVANAHLLDLWDHAFFVYREDHVVADFLATLPEHRTVVLDVTPTVENLARVAFDILAPLYQDIYGNHLRLEKIRLYETPNCWADIHRA
jgi:6-pyruvoyltetrahydropterin/6-carboxytetrahydropterin synthase